MFEIGDIVGILAPTTGYEKYHLCIKLVDEAGAARFIYLNSDPNFDDTYAVPCDRIPCLQPSRTGVTAFSFSMLPGYNEHQLRIFKAKKLGELPVDVAWELRAFVDNVQALTLREKQLVATAFDTIIQRGSAP